MSFLTSVFGINYPPWPNLGTENFQDAQDPSSLYRTQASRSPLGAIDNQAEYSSESEDDDTDKMVKTRATKRKQNPKKVQAKPADKAKRPRGQAKSDDEEVPISQVLAKGGPNVKNQLMKLMEKLVDAGQMEADDDEMVEAIDATA